MYFIIIEDVQRGTFIIIIYLFMDHYYKICYSEITNITIGAYLLKIYKRVQIYKLSFAIIYLFCASAKTIELIWLKGEEID